MWIWLESVPRRGEPQDNWLWLCPVYSCIQNLHSCIERLAAVTMYLPLLEWAILWKCMCIYKKGTIFFTSNGTRHTLILANKWRFGEKREYLGDWIKETDLYTILSVNPLENPHPHKPFVEWPNSLDNTKFIKVVVKRTPISFLLSHSNGHKTHSPAFALKSLWRMFARRWIKI